MSPVLHCVPEWLENHQDFFLPPVCNKMMHGQGQLKVFFVAGPNQRKDFHIEEGEEFFYMLKGDMILKVMERGQFRDIVIREGQVFLLPGRIPHSPQRFENTMGLVIERERKPQEMDCLRYFVDGQTEILFERWFHCEDLGTQLPPIIKEFLASQQHYTGKPILGTITENPPLQVDNKRHLGEAFNLEDWICEKRDEIIGKGNKSLFDPEHFRSKIEMLGGPEARESLELNTETFLWQWKGTSHLCLEGAKALVLKENDTVLLLAGERWRLESQTGMTLTVKLEP